MKNRFISAAVMLVVALTCVLASMPSRVIFFAVAGIRCAYELSRQLEKLEGIWDEYEVYDKSGK